MTSFSTLDTPRNDSNLLKGYLTVGQTFWEAHQKNRPSRDDKENGFGHIGEIDFLDLLI